MEENQNGKKIFANHISDKGLISQTCKELILLKKKKKTWLKTGQRKSRDVFPKLFNGQHVHENVSNVT